MAREISEEQRRRRQILSLLFEESEETFWPTPTVGWFTSERTNSHLYVFKPEEVDKHLPGGCLKIAALGSGYTVYRYGRTEAYSSLEEFDARQALLYPEG